MRVSFEWLREFVPVEMTPEAVADRLTMAGLEVEDGGGVGHRVRAHRRGAESPRSPSIPIPGACWSAVSRWGLRS